MIIEERSLVKMGRVSVMISLPRWWVKSNGLRAGDKLKLSTTDGKQITVEPIVKAK